MSAHNVLVTLGTGAVDRPELDYYATDPKEAAAGIGTV